MSYRHFAALSAVTVCLLFANGVSAQEPPTISVPASPTPMPAADTPDVGSTDESKLAVLLVMTDGDRSVTRTRREMGFALASKAGEPVKFAIDLPALKAALERIGPTFHQEAVAPRPAIDHGKFVIAPGNEARALDVPTTAQKIVDAVTKDPATTKFSVALDKHASPLTADRFKGIDGVLASFSTRTNANPKRNHNVALAAATIDGTLLPPGGVFSLNDKVGERTQKRGFLTAPVFVNAEMVPGIGGGVSQITGTLFNAAARAGLRIVEVYPHSRPVAYLPLGYDATVAFGEEDLKFKNNTAAPVYFDYRFNLKTRQLTATLFGKKTPGQVVRLHASIQERAPGKVDAQLYRITKINGKVVAKERLFSHHYRWDPSKPE